jgi:hypothetical protein
VQAQGRIQRQCMLRLSEGGVGRVWKMESNDGCHSGQTGGGPRKIPSRATWLRADQPRCGSARLFLNLGLQACRGSLWALLGTHTYMYMSVLECMHRQMVCCVHGRSSCAVSTAYCLLSTVYRLPKANGPLCAARKHGRGTGWPLDELIYLQVVWPATM